MAICPCSSFFVGLHKVNHKGCVVEQTLFTQKNEEKKMKMLVLIYILILLLLILIFTYVEFGFNTFLSGKEKKNLSLIRFNRKSV